MATSPQQSTALCVLHCPIPAPCVLASPSFSLLQPCPENTATPDQFLPQPGSDAGPYSSPEACQAKPGYGWSNRVATACPVGEFKELYSNLECQPCGDGLTTVATGASSTSDCLPLPGWAKHQQSDRFAFTCPVGSYSEGGTSALADCTLCASGSTTEYPGSTENSQCSVCSPGWGQNSYAANGGTMGPLCDQCSPGFYSPGGDDDACTQCEQGQVSPPGASDSSECLDEFMSTGVCSAQAVIDCATVCECVLGTGRRWRPMLLLESHIVCSSVRPAPCCMQPEHKQARLSLMHVCTLLPLHVFLCPLQLHTTSSARLLLSGWTQPPSPAAPAHNPQTSMPVRTRAGATTSVCTSFSALTCLQRRAPPLGAGSGWRRRPPTPTPLWPSSCGLPTTASGRCVFVLVCFVVRWPSRVGGVWGEALQLQVAQRDVCALTA